MEQEKSAERHSEAEDSIIKNGSVVTEGKGSSIHCLSIIGQIEGHYILPEGQKATKYEHHSFARGNRGK